MTVDGRHYRTIWLAQDGRSVEIIDQTRLPHEFVVERLSTYQEVARAIHDMQVRGAPLIGVAAAYGMCLAMLKDPSAVGIARAYDALLATRPTAVNLRWALDEMRDLLLPLPSRDRVDEAFVRAAQIADEDVAMCEAIGEHGLCIIRDVWQAKGEAGRVNVLTHCNAGWLAAVDWGTALAPVYKAYDAGIPVHVWVSETRPRNQGASLTAWELRHHGVPHTLVVDDASGHLMQHGQVDLCLVGTDRTTASGDVCNKVGTYLKALAARDNGVPFYVAAPSPSIDWTLEDGIAEILIEERDGAEVTTMTGRTAAGDLATVRLAPEATPVANVAFDVTPARLVAGIITERGVCAASEEGLQGLFGAAA